MFRHFYNTIKTKRFQSKTPRSGRITTSTTSKQTQNRNRNYLALGSAAVIAIGSAIYYKKYKNNTLFSNPGLADDSHTHHHVSMKNTMLGMGAEVMQNFAPVNSIHMYLNGLHCYAHDINRQVIAHHYCSHLSDDIQQCVIYDSNKSDARLIGIEYVISEKLFKDLPEEEKKMWHSHSFEVASGLLVAPRIPTSVENVVMQDLAKTYGKTIHLWQVDKGHEIPLGHPQLMMALTDDSQVDKKLLEMRNKELGINPDKLRKERTKLHYFEVDPAVDGITKGTRQWFELKSSGGSNTGQKR
eukprot:TRINITY_DN11103_c0_g1_i1.p1 TRINITY_DN11103_c0_g1~~TRINITY_DN11103_c0_g1_i1.p1  ORF type:complete len:299 (+),score=41.53 TRINITY_DN11103_c0_g1_i1:78-974(+)